jgi:6-pyruvoyltetrahydropterin/6-carboxytetrahydropterin synthase
MAHAIKGYNGKCCNIHGHSYVLHVTVKSAEGRHGFVSPPGFVIDFKELKEIVNVHIVNEFDHKLVLSQEYVDEFAKEDVIKNLLLFDAEPTAENMLMHISRKLNEHLPAHIMLHALKLYETNDSYAEWTND